MDSVDPGTELYEQAALKFEVIQAWLTDICHQMGSPRRRPVTPPLETTATDPQPAGPSTRLRTRLARADELVAAPSEIQDLDTTPRPGPWFLAQPPCRSLDGSPTKSMRPRKQAEHGPTASSSSGAPSLHADASTASQQFFHHQHCIVSFKGNISVVDSKWLLQTLPVAC